MLKECKKAHKVWWKFEKFLISNFGENYHQNLSGYETQKKIEEFIRKSCSEVRLVRCDDEVFASSILLLVPHPTMGISILFVPQCTTIGNYFFLYESHFKILTEELEKMKKVYDEE